MNQGLVRQINDIVRPYRKARMGLLIVISNPVGQVVRRHRWHGSIWLVEIGISIRFMARRP